MGQPKQSSFIVIEGLDGSGTTTVAALLEAALKARDLRVQLTAEPTSGAFGTLLRQHLRGQVDLTPSTAALAFTADRAEHLDTLVRPALLRGRWVISDRYLLSTLAYQGAEGVDMGTILAASASFEVPDVTFLLEAPDSIRHERMVDRRQVERYEDPALDEQLRRAYERAAELLRSAGHRIERVDASRKPDVIVSELLAGLDVAS